MASFTLTVDDADLQNFLSALGTQYGYSGDPKNTPQLTQFVLNAISTNLTSSVVAVLSSQATAQAVAAVPPPVPPQITLLQTQTVSGPTGPSGP